MDDLILFLVAVGLFAVGFFALAWYMTKRKKRVIRKEPHRPKRTHAQHS